MNKINKNIILDSLEDLSETNNWGRFNDKIIVKLYNTFKGTSKEKWNILIESIMKECDYPPAYSTFYKTALSLNLLDYNKSEYEQVAEALENKPKISRKERLNIIGTKFPELAEKLKMTQ